jgi:hypothetical protein
MIHPREGNVSMIDIFWILLNTFRLADLISLFLRWWSARFAAFSMHKHQYRYLCKTIKPRKETRERVSDLFISRRHF